MHGRPWGVHGWHAGRGRGAGDYKGACTACMPLIRMAMVTKPSCRPPCATARYMRSLWHDKQLAMVANSPISQ